MHQSTTHNILGIFRILSIVKSMEHIHFEQSGHNALRGHYDNLMESPKVRQYGLVVGH